MDIGKLLDKAVLVLMLVYACLINSTLVISMFISFTVAVVLLTVIEMSDKDMMNNILDESDVSNNFVRKYNNLLLFGCAVFIVLTSIIYKILTEN